MPISEDPLDHTQPCSAPDPLDGLLARSRTAPPDPWLASRVLQQVREEQIRSATTPGLWSFWWNQRIIRVGALAAVLLALVLLGHTLPKDSAAESVYPLSENSSESGEALSEWSDEAIFEDLDILLADYQMEAWLAFDSSSFH